MPIKLKNNVSSTLASAITASDVGLTVVTGTGALFPTLAANDYFYATLISTGGTVEVVKVTARSGDSMTIQRGQDNTAAQSFAVGARIEMRVNAQAVLDASGIASEFVSVKDYGATGDGITDDSTAIQLAINENTGRTIYFPSGTYIIGTRVVFATNTHLAGDKDTSVLKLRAQNWPVAAGLMFEAVLKTDIKLDSLVFDGTKGNVGTSRSPMLVFFRSQRIELHNCTFRDTEGICLNVSTDIDEFVADSCKFLRCGGDPSNSDGYRKQAIAFSMTSPFRTQNVRITNCYFYRQGLDCISLADCDNVHISGNTAVESYTLVYTNPLPSTTTNLVISDNVVNVCSEFGAASGVPPLAVDLVSCVNFTVVNNTFANTDVAAIGIFSDCQRGAVLGNIVTNPMRSTGSRLRFCGIEMSNVSNILVAHNVIVDTDTPPLMDFGILVRTTAINTTIANNTITNPLTARFGYYATNPFLGSVFPFTSPAQISATTQIIDSNASAGLTTHYRRLNVLENSTNPAVTITQTGSGACLVVEDQASPDGTAFSIDADGDVGIRVNPALFGGPFSASGTGVNNLMALQAFGEDAAAIRLEAYKTRNANPYAQGLLQPGDGILGLSAFGSDGTAYRPAARIVFTIDGTPGAGSMPGRIEFYTTPDGSISALRRLNLKQNGALRFVPQQQPSSAEAGDVYYDSSTNKLRCYNGTIWNDLF